jgi:hypothetical protein
LTGVYFTFVIFGFLSVGEEGVDGLVVFKEVGSFVGSGRGFARSVFLASLSSNSCFWLTNWVIIYFICFFSDWCLLTS